MALLVLVVAVALAFDFTNGFHDTANYVATWVGTRALSPRWAVLISAASHPSLSETGNGAQHTLPKS